MLTLGLRVWGYRVAGYENQGARAFVFRSWNYFPMASLATKIEAQGFY